MWNQNSKIEFYPMQNAENLSYSYGMASNSPKLPKPRPSIISSGYPFISGLGPQYRPTPIHQTAPAPVIHQVVHAPPIRSMTMHRDHSRIISTVGQGLVTSASFNNVNHISSIPRDKMACGTNGIFYSATPMTSERENVEKCAFINKPRSPQPSTSGLVRRPKKRKSLDSHECGSYGGKVFINEEKMANCLQDLSLAPNSCSSDNTNPSKSPVASLPLSSWLLDPRKPTDACRIIEEIDSRLSLEDIDSDTEGDEGSCSLENNNNNDPEEARLIISKEIEMGLGNNDILPNSLFEQMNKPSMEMVLWKPPGDFVKNAVAGAMKPSSIDLSGSDTISDSTNYDMSLSSERNTKKSNNSQEIGCHSFVTEIRPDVIVEDLFDSVDDEMEL